MLKRLKKIEEETDRQLDLIRSQRSKELEKIKGVDRFYDGSDQKIIELENGAIKETIDNINDAEKVFDVKISGKPFNINKYSNLTYFATLLFRGVNKKSRKKSKKISNIINELEKKFDPNK